MRSFVSVLGAVPYGDGLLLGDALCEYSVCCARKCTQSHSIEDLWKATMTIMIQVREGESRLAEKATAFDPSTHPSCRALAHLPPEAITAVTEVRA